MSVHNKLLIIIIKLLTKLHVYMHGKCINFSNQVMVTSMKGSVLHTCIIIAKKCK